MKKEELKTLCDLLGKLEDEMVENYKEDPGYDDEGMKKEIREEWDIDDICEDNDEIALIVGAHGCVEDYYKRDAFVDDDDEEGPDEDEDIVDITGGRWDYLLVQENDR